MKQGSSHGITLNSLLHCYDLNCLVFNLPEENVVHLIVAAGAAVMPDVAMVADHEPIAAGAACAAVAAGTAHPGVPHCHHCGAFLQQQHRPLVARP